MTELSFQRINSVIPAGSRRVFIGYSGGIDSHVLLHLCATEACLKQQITAVYIHHGLQQAADDWGHHCRQQCQALAVDYLMIKVDAAAKSGESPEAAAREARYHAFAGLLEKDDILLLAQHREDQMETLLLQLFRGSGLPGMAAMPVVKSLALGKVVRPLLNVAKVEIQAYAKRHNLFWIEDPSNDNSDFDRNFLRNQIVPLLKQRWPSLDKTVFRAASHCKEANQFLAEWAEEAFQLVFDPIEQTLQIDSWRVYNGIQCNWLLRHWLLKRGLQPPSSAILQAIVEQVINAKEDANPQLHTQGFVIRKFKQQLFCLDEQYFQQEIGNRVWLSQDAELRLRNGFRLIRQEACVGIDKQLWLTHTVTVEYRRGGEKIKLPGRAGRHCLKKLYQQAGIPPWEREARPLIYLDGRLAAVAGLWVAEWAWCQKGDCYHLLWLLE